MSRWLLLAACVLAIGISGGVVGSGVAATPPTPAPPDTVAATENVFLPEDEALDECVSALPPPTCGSEARGGWRQTLIFVAIGAGLAFIVWRIVRAARASRRSS